MRIELPFFDLGVDRIKQGVEHYLDLNTGHMIYHVEVHVEKQPDQDEGRYAVVDDYICYHGLCMKNNIAAVDYDYAIFDKDEEFDCWVVEISVSGMATRIKIKCETQEFATSLHKKIADWLLS